MLADRSLIKPQGIVKDVCVGIGKFSLPCDFMILDVNVHTEEVPLILGRPFMATGDAWLGVKDKIVVFQVNGEKVAINVDSMMKQPSDPPQPRAKDHVQQCIDEMMEFLTKYKEEGSVDEEELFDLKATCIVEQEVDQSESEVDQSELQPIVGFQPLQTKSTVDIEEKVRHNRNAGIPHQARLKMIKEASEARMFDLKEFEEVRLDSTRIPEPSSESMGIERSFSPNGSTMTNYLGNSTSTFQLTHQK